MKLEQRMVGQIPRRLRDQWRLSARASGTVIQAENIRFAPPIQNTVVYVER